MKFKRIVIAVAAALLMFNTVAAQEFSNDVVKQDCEKKHYIIGAVGVFAVNGVIGGWNRFVSRAPWAKVGYDDIKRFWERDIEFDCDWYWTNFVLHPYQGGLYYLAARNANLNLWESLAYTTAGSFMWEFFFETNAPSTNDLVYTSLGGMVTGEMLYRLSLEAQAKNHTVLSFMGNPVRLYSDFVEGHAPRGPSGMLCDSSIKTMMGFGLGTSKADGNKVNEVFPFSAGFEYRAVYADPYGHDSNEPYSQFYFEFGASGGKGSGEGQSDTEKKIMYNVHIFSDGMLISRAPDFGENVDTTFGISLEYDFFWDSFMEFSSLTPGVAFKQRFNGQDSWKAYQVRLGAVTLGTSDYYYLRRGITTKSDEVVRDYGYSTGVEFVGKLAAAKKAGVEFDWTLHGYGLWKYPYQTQPDDDSGWEFLAFSDLSLEMPVSKSVYLGISDEFYIKRAIYDNVPSVWTMHNAVNVYARFKFL